MINTSGFENIIFTIPRESALSDIDDGVGRDSVIVRF